MSFFDKLQELYGTINLYEVLHLEKSASESEIKRAYRRISLQVHPDRVPEAEKSLATEKFQALSRVHSVLSDQGKRDLYDESGEIDEDIVVQERDWDAYWRLLFKKITVESIKEFEKTYRGSEEERNDLKAAYVDYEGDVDLILDNMFCSTLDDEDRFREMIEEFIKKKEVPKYEAFVNETKTKKRRRRTKAEQEAKEAEELAGELGLKDAPEDSLKQMILQRQSQRGSAMDSMIAGLEAKYCKPKKQKASKAQANKSKKK